MSDSAKAVFLSYASQDVAAALSLCTALRAAGVEAWFDQDALVGGDAWDRKIREQIATCALFVPLISANTQARLEGYFRLEWKLAALRTHGMAEEKCFLLPVVIDGTPDAEGKVPTEFRAVQWIRLPGGEATSAFSERVRHLVKGRPESGLTTTSRGEVAASSSEKARGDAPPPGAKSRSISAWAIVLFGAVALAGVLGAVWFSRTGPERVPPASVSVPKLATPVAYAKRRIAVLPFDNYSSKKEEFEYFADGITDHMISRLARVSGLTVKARNAVMKFKGREKDISALGRELGVGTILESSVAREGNRLRITVQLIDVETQNHLWSGDFDKSTDDVLAIQADVAESVAIALKGELIDEEKHSLQRWPTESFAAYDFYLRGKPFFGTGRDATMQSIDMLEKAIALDATFAEAHAELSLAYGNLAYFLEAGNKEIERKAEVAAASALRLDPDLPEAHVAQARIYWRPSSGFQHEKAITEVRRALAIRSNLDEAYSLLGAICFHVGLIDQSLDHYKKADEINPGNPTVDPTESGRNMLARTPILAPRKRARGRSRKCRALDVNANMFRPDPLEFRDATNDDGCDAKAFPGIDE